MHSIQPHSSTPRWRPIIVVLTALTLVSLLFNVYMLVSWLRLRQQAGPVLEAAAGLGRSLRSALEEPLYIELPIQRTVQLAVSTTLPLDTGFALEIELPYIGSVSREIPIHLEVPVHLDVPLRISATLPLAIDLQKLPIAEDLGRVGEALEGLDPRKEHP